MMKAQRILEERISISSHICSRKGEQFGINIPKVAPSVLVLGTGPLQEGVGLGDGAVRALIGGVVVLKITTNSCNVVAEKLNAGGPVRRAELHELVGGALHVGVCHGGGQH